VHRIAVINGPNLNLLGRRRPEVYGDTTLPTLDRLVERWGGELGVEVSSFQSNHEGAIIDRLHEAQRGDDAVIINPGAYTHYSYAIHDAIEAIDVPVVEVHISNIKEREAWRRTSVVEPACAASIYGRGVDGYRWALRHLVARAAWPVETVSYGDHRDQVGDLRLPDAPGPHPVAIVIHGGFWRDQWARDVMDGFAVDLTRRGWATWNIEYRRVGGGGGWPLTFADVAAAIDTLKTLAAPQRLDLERTTVIGHSAGGHLAAWAAARHRLGAGAVGSEVGVAPTRAVVLAGVVDLSEAHRMGLGDGAVEGLMRRGPEDERYNAADPARLLPTGVATVLVHGEDDTAVPVAISTSFAAAAAAAGQAVGLATLPAIGHMELIEPGSAAWPAVIDALAAG
jgi:3-dehydroquinate dehydratase type II